MCPCASVVGGVHPVALLAWPAAALLHEVELVAWLTVELLHLVRIGGRWPVVDKLQHLVELVASADAAARCRAAGLASGRSAAGG